MAEHYAIFRTEKLKAPSNVAGSAAHIERSKPTPNADPTIANRWLIGGPGLYQQAKALWATIPKMRSDAVHAFETLMSASPEAFADPNFDLDKWAADSVAFLQKQFKGAVILGASLHLDELTPHIHAIVVPTDLKPDGTVQLNCKKYLGSPAKLAKMQTDYAKAVESHGLSRGVQGSKATHTKVQEFYGAMAKANAAYSFAGVIDIPKPPVLLMGKAKEAWVLDAEKAIVERMRPVVGRLKGDAAKAEVLQRSNDQLKASNGRLSQRLESVQDKRKAEADRLREIPVEHIAERLGCYPTKKDKHLWETPCGKTSINGKQFYNHETGEKGGGAIDFVKYVQGCDYVGAITWLRDEYDPSAAIEAAAWAARRQAEEDLRKATQKPFVAPEHVDRNWPRVRDYLTRIRGLAGALVDRLREDGWLRADYRNNAVFLKNQHNTTVSAELKGTGQSSFSGSRGNSAEGVFLVRGGTERLAVCEAAIDAISYVQLHPEATAIATGGSGKWRAALDFIARHGKRFAQVVCASDNDDAGRKMAENLSLPHTPPAAPHNDWNDVLTHVEPLAPPAAPATSRGPTKPLAPTRRHRDIESDDVAPR